MLLILGTNSIKDTGFNVSHSLRFNHDEDAYLTRTASSGSYGTNYTISFWFKNTYPVDSGEQYIYMGGDQNTSNNLWIRLNGTSRSIYLRSRTGGSNDCVLITNRVFRDPSAWYHIVYEIDTTQGTAANRVKLYVNGTQETSFSTETYPDQNDTFKIATSGKDQDIGRRTDGSSYTNFGLMLAEFCILDGTTLSASSFGEFDSDTPTIWKPKDPSGLSFGTNGFYLNVPGPSTGQNANGLGGDSSGNGNHFGSSALSAQDRSSDTCTNNFCTLNPLTLQDTDYLLSEGNLKISIGGNNERKAVLGTFGLTSGKWYWEVKYTSTTGQSFAQIGISDIIQGTEAPTVGGFAENGKMGYYPYDYGYRGEHSSGNGLKTNNANFTSYGDGWTVGDIIGVALDLDNNKIFFSKNGAFQASGNPETGANPTFSITDPASTGTGAYFPAIGKEAADDPVFEFNFGNPSFSITSGNTDANGFGNFEYAVPSGYFSLCSKNLAEFG